MVALATASDDRFLMSTMEADTLRKRYSVDTLERMQETYPRSRCLFIVGTDMYAEIDAWKDYTRIFALASLAVVGRHGFSMSSDAAPFETLAPDARVRLSDSPSVYYLPWIREEASSTRIREAASRGEDLGAWVPAAVAAYVKKHRLYKAGH
jgi:nicotinate-nucleotide adenylyltransferase